MAFQLVLEIPDTEGVQNPAFWRVCSVPVLQRLVIGASRGGAAQVAITGPSTRVEDARQLLLADERTRDLGYAWGEVPATDLPVVRAPADVLVSVPVWKALDAAGGPAEVPGAPGLRRERAGGTDAAGEHVGAADGRTSEVPGARTGEVPGAPLADVDDSGGLRPRENSGAAAGVVYPPLWTDAPPPGAWALQMREPGDRRRAKNLIFDHITKSTSGPVSRYFNSLFSKPLSRLLVETPMTPNQMTFTNTAIGIVAALFYALGSLGAVAVGGVIMQLGSALDRCDGELARSKYMESEKGAWMDTVGDNITYIAFVIGLAVGYARFASGTEVAWAPWAWALGLGMVLLTVGVIGGMALYVHVKKLGGTMTAISHDFRAQVDEGDRGIVFWLLDRVKVLGERDQFSLILMAVSVMPWLTGNPDWYHGLFFATAFFIAAACVYFFLGALKVQAATRRAQRAAG